MKIGIEIGSRSHLDRLGRTHFNDHPLGQADDSPIRPLHTRIKINLMDWCHWPFAQIVPCTARGDDK